MIISQNEQGSYEWKEERHESIGGTTLSDLMVKKPVEESALYYSLIASHTEPFFDEETFINTAMQRGTDLEPSARFEGSQYLNLEFFEFGTCRRKGFPLNHCSPDGFTRDLKDGTEIKCPSSAVHIKYCMDNVFPKEYHWQGINYFLINEKLERLHFISYRPENRLKPLFVVTITRDSLLDMGTKAKPNMVKVSDLVEQAEIKSLTMGSAIEKAIDKLSF